MTAAALQADPIAGLILVGILVLVMMILEAVNEYKRHRFHHRFSGDFRPGSNHHLPPDL